MPYDGDFRVASEYGARIDPINGESAFHGGIDLVSLGSRAIKCVEDGIVLRSRIVTDKTNRTSEWGNYVSVQSGERIYYYCHMSERLVSAGDRVRAGDVLGIEGSTGRSTGSHLSQARKNGRTSRLGKGRGELGRGQRNHAGRRQRKLPSRRQYHA